MIVDAGEIAVVAPDAPVLQEYVEAPDTESVADCPAHTAVGPLTARSGKELVATLTVCVLTHPFDVLLPVTVYVAGTDGVNETAADVPPPVHE
jgi:hypothetical protein